MQNETTLKIYYDGKLDYRATYAPVIKRKLIAAANAACDKMVEWQQLDRPKA